MKGKRNDAIEKEHCPKCNSKDLNFMPWLGLIYQCRDCGWRGPVVVSKKRIKRERANWTKIDRNHKT